MTELRPWKTILISKNQDHEVKVEGRFGRSLSYVELRIEGTNKIGYYNLTPGLDPNIEITALAIQYLADSGEILNQ